jgi:hypothetical protein
VSLEVPANSADNTHARDECRRRMDYVFAWFAFQKADVDGDATAKDIG